MTFWCGPPFSTVMALGRRITSRSAPPISEARVPSPSRRSAASASRASWARRTATTRGSTGAPSSTTSAKAPERSRRSAHQGARAGSAGRTTHRESTSMEVRPSVSAAQKSRGSRVRVASIQATQCPVAMVVAAKDRAIVVLPKPGAARSSVIRPGGSPPPGRSASSAAKPVGSPGVALGVPATTVASCSRSAARDIFVTRRYAEDSTTSNYRINAENGKVGS